jgi:hypothetical protein
MGYLGISLLCLFSTPGLADDTNATIISKARSVCESYETVFLMRARRSPRSISQVMAL